MLIARDEKSFEEIVQWVQTHTAHNTKEYDTKFQEYVINPIDTVLSLYRQGDPTSIKKLEATMNDWLAVDIYPEYKMEVKETVKFLTDLMKKFSPPSSAPPPPQPPSPPSSP